MGRYFLRFNVPRASLAPSGSHTTAVFNFVGCHWYQVQAGFDSKTVLPVPHESALPDPEVRLKVWASPPCSAKLVHFFSQFSDLEVRNSRKRTLRKSPGTSRSPREMLVGLGSSQVPPWSLAPVSLAKSLTRLHMVDTSPRQPSRSRRSCPDRNRHLSLGPSVSPYLFLMVRSKEIAATPLTRGSGEVSILAACVVIRLANSSSTLPALGNSKAHVIRHHPFLLAQFLERTFLCHLAHTNE